MDSLESLFSLRGRRALVTGASSGLGVECAVALALAGADVALVARRSDRVEKLAAEISKIIKSKPQELAPTFRSTAIWIVRLHRPMTLSAA